MSTKVNAYKKISGKQERKRYQVGERNITQIKWVPQEHSKLTNINLNLPESWRDPEKERMINWKNETSLNQ